MPRSFPLISPGGTKVEVVGEARRDILVGRGYAQDEPPPSPMPQRADVRISAAVAHAPWAADRARNLEGYEIPGLEVVSDTRRQGCWPTVRRAWERTSGTHHLVLTDDLTLPAGFWGALEQVVSIHPSSVISLFAITRGAKLAEGRWCISWGVTGAANVLPSGMVEPFLRWERENIVPGCPHDDIRLTAFVISEGIGALTPVPCLVNHGEFPGVIEDSPVFGRRHAFASVFAPDVRGLDWTEGAESPVFIGMSVERPEAWLVGGRTVAELRKEAHVG